MARIRMVTRTINDTEYEVMAINTTNCEVYTFTHHITGDTPNQKKAEKLMKQWFENDEVKIVKVTPVNVVKKLYGIREDLFIQYAEELPPRTKVDSTGVAIIE